MSDQIGRVFHFTGAAVNGGHAEADALTAPETTLRSALAWCPLGVEVDHVSPDDEPAGRVSRLRRRGRRRGVATALRRRLTSSLSARGRLGLARDRDADQSRNGEEHKS
jgi:hypothetical protein